MRSAAEWPAVLPDAAFAAPADGGEAAPLGRNAGFVSTIDGQQVAKVIFPAAARPVFVPSPAQLRAWHLRSVARDILKKAGVQKRLRFCGEKISYRDRGVKVFQRPDHAIGRLGGVCVCGHSILCPVCAPRIAAFRAEEIADAFERAKRLGYRAYLDTFTMPHEAGNDLYLELRVLAAAWAQFSGGREGVCIRDGCLGNHAAREITFGLSGWHPHLHQLRYHLPGSHQENLMNAQWLSALHFVGRWTPAAMEYAYHSAEVLDQQGATYTAKISTAATAAARGAGLEVAMSSTKGRNIATLLADHAAGCVTSGSVWLQGCKAVMRSRVSSVRWSRGLREKLAINAPEATDEAIALEKAETLDVYLGSLTTHQWRGIINRKAEYTLVRAAQNGADAVNTLLDNLELGCLHEEIDEPRNAP